MVQVTPKIRLQRDDMQWIIIYSGREFKKNKAGKEHEGNRKYYHTLTAAMMKVFDMMVEDEASMIEAGTVADLAAAITKAKVDFATQLQPLLTPTIAFTKGGV